MTGIKIGQEWHYSVTGTDYHVFLHVPPLFFLCNQEALSQMEEAITSCNPKQAKQWLQVNPNLAFAYQPGKPLLIHYAAQQGCQKVFRFLLHAYEAAGPDAQLPPKDVVMVDQSSKGTLLHSAAMGGQVGIVKLLQKEPISLGPEHEWLTSYDASGKLPLHLAAEKGHVKAVKHLLREAESTLNQETSNGTTALDLACAAGHEKVVGALLKKKQARLKPEQLAAASAGGHEEVVKRLIAKGGDAMLAKDVEGMTPLHHATRNGHMGVLRVLLPCSKVRRAVLDAVNAPDAEGNTPLHYAVLEGYYRPADKLKAKKGKSLASGAFKGWVGYLTCGFKHNIGPAYGQADMTQYLLGHGADVMAVNKKGETPKELLVYGGSRKKWGFARVLEWFGM